MKKYRNELKYICSEGELAIIRNSISAVCSLDKHAGNTGQYHIRSVYFDDYYNSGFGDNENGNDPREKFRIRTYNGDESRITLECKEKNHTMTSKESCVISRELYDDIIVGNFRQEQADCVLLNKFYQLYQTKQLRPKVIVAYDREPFVYDIGNVRITIDKNIGGTNKIEEFFNESINLRPIMETGKHVLEVKYDELLPSFIYELAGLSTLSRTAFSKYYLCRKYNF